MRLDDLAGQLGRPGSNVDVVLQAIGDRGRDLLDHLGGDLRRHGVDDRLDHRRRRVRALLEREQRVEIVRHVARCPVAARWSTRGTRRSSVALRLGTCRRCHRHVLATGRCGLAFSSGAAAKKSIGSVRAIGSIGSCFLVPMCREGHLDHGAPVQPGRGCSALPGTTADASATSTIGVTGAGACRSSTTLGGSTTFGGSAAIGAQSARAQRPPAAPPPWVVRSGRSRSRRTDRPRQIQDRRRQSAARPRPARATPLHGCPSLAPTRAAPADARRALSDPRRTTRRPLRTRAARAARPAAAAPGPQLVVHVTRPARSRLGIAKPVLIHFVTGLPGVVPDCAVGMRPGERGSPD